MLTQWIVTGVTAAGTIALALVALRQYFRDEQRDQRRSEQLLAQAVGPAWEASEDLNRTIEYMKVGREKLERIEYQVEETRKHAEAWLEYEHFIELPDFLNKLISLATQAGEPHATKAGNAFAAFHEADRMLRAVAQHTGAGFKDEDNRSLVARAMKQLEKARQDIEQFRQLPTPLVS